MKFISKQSGILFLVSVSAMLLAETLKVYFIMPLPGSQWQNNVELAFNINQFIWPVRLIAGSIVLFTFLSIIKQGVVWKQIGAIVLLLVTGTVVYLTNFVMLAEKMFYQPDKLLMSPASQNSVEGSRLVIGVELNGEAKAYPISFIGYHHQVRDNIAGEEVMITYCTVCRTGRVYKPVVNGKSETFRLVGMDQFNAMFEDATTKSWWRQATGECCAGPLKGNRLPEVPSQQVTLSAWLQLYPNSLIMQPDSKFEKQYASMTGYDDGSSKSELTGTDTSSWQKKSWVIGIVTDNGEKMFDWNKLKSERVIHDKVGVTPVVLLFGNDAQSYFVFELPVVDGSPSQFTAIDSSNQFADNATASLWNTKGECVSGQLVGNKLKPVRAYQEFYHSFSTFHPKAVGGM